MKKRNVKQVFTMVLATALVISSLAVNATNVYAAKTEETGDLLNSSLETEDADMQEDVETQEDAESEDVETQEDAESEDAEGEDEENEDAESEDAETQDSDSADVTITQKAISLNIGSNQSERNITWYADDENPGSLQLALKSAMNGDEFPESSAETYTTEVQETNDTGFYSNQLTMSHLAPDTKYVYRLINGDTTSKTYTFKTGSEESFSFLFAGDPQIGASGYSEGDTEGWTSSLNNALAALPGTNFIISAGDQVNTADSETEYTGFLEPGILSSIPLATVVGNHDSTSAAYSQHFNYSNDGTYGATTAGSDYWYVYNNVLFLNLNSNNLSAGEHKAFLEKAIAANPDVDWKIVIFHHSIYSAAIHAVQDDILQRREQLAPIFKDIDIDVVLMGHDHVYVRSYMMDGTTPIVEKNEDGSPLSSVTNPEGTLYVTANSASGSKYYSIQSQNLEYSAVQSQEKTPNISNVKITPTSFTITTYRTNNMSVVDTFTIKHSEEEPDPETYTVTFDSQDGSEVDSQSVSEGDTVTEPSDPTRTGYTFEGWYKEAECENEWNFASDTVTENTTLYAKWKADDIPVTEISLNKTELTLHRGETSALEVSVSPSDASNKEIIWSSSDTRVASVDENGKVMANGYGTAFITAEAKDGSGIKATCKVRVRYYNPFYPFAGGWHMNNHYKNMITSINKGLRKTIHNTKWEIISASKVR